MITEQLLALGMSDHLAGAIEYFVYDSIKILLLLFILIASIGYLRTYLSKQRIQQWLGSNNPVAAYTGASLFGVITPFCSCSSIPIYLGLQSAGVPLGVAMTFLITSPLVNEYVLVLMVAAFGLRIAVLYLLAGMIIGVLGGIVISHLKLEHYLEPLGGTYKQEQFKNQRARVHYGVAEAIDITKAVWVYVLVGVAVGAAIHNYVPQTLIDGVVGATGFFSVPLAALLGIPLYGSGAALVPIAQALFEKGLPLGTVLAFLMSTVGLSFPAAVILRRAMKLPLILWFFGIVTAGIVVVGYLFNVI